MPRSTVLKRLAAAIPLLCASSIAQQRHVFDVESAASTITFSGTLSVLGLNGSLVGQPPTFNPQGAIDVIVTVSGSTITSAQVVDAGSRLSVPLLNAVVPNIFPFLPPLATGSITGLEAVFTTVDPTTLAPASFVVAAGGAFSTHFATSIIAGTANVNALGQQYTINLAGRTGRPQPISGTLTPTANGLRLQIPTNSTFPFTSSSTGVTITGTGTVSGTAYATSRALATDVTNVSRAAGGTQRFCLSAGTARAGGLYLLLGTASGTQPGLNLGAVTLPLNPDSWLIYTATYPNFPPYASSAGFLSGIGLATATVTVPRHLPVPIGFTFHHAYLVISNGVIVFTSNPMPLVFTS